MKALIRSLMAVLLPVSLLAGCATLPAYLHQAGTRTPSPLDLSIGYDLAFLRVDLKRATHSELRFIREPDSNGTMKLRPEVLPVDNPYRPLIVSFGNGIIMDLNGNLSLDLLRLYDLNAASSFDITEHFGDLLPAGVSLVRRGRLFERRGTGLMVEHLTAVSDGKIVHVDGGPGERNARIVRGPSSLSYEPSGRRDWRTATVVQPSSGSVLFQASSRKTSFTMIDPKQIRSNRGLELTRKGDRIDIVLRSPGGISASFVFVKTRIGCTITGGNGFGRLQVMREGNEIYVTKNGSLAATVTVH